MVYRAGVDGGRLGATVFYNSVSVDAVGYDVTVSVSHVHSLQIQDSDAKVYNNYSRGYAGGFF